MNKVALFCLMVLVTKNALADTKLEAVQLYNGNYVYCEKSADCITRTVKELTERKPEPKPEPKLLNNMDVMSVQFKLGSAKLDKESKRSLNDFISGKKIIALQIVGHTDVVGAKELNAKLAKQRAENVSAFLKGQVNPEVINVNSECCIENPPTINTKARRVSIKMEWVDE